MSCWQDFDYRDDTFKAPLEVPIPHSPTAMVLKMRIYANYKQDIV
jgi:hypothetical protein